MSIDFKQGDTLTIHCTIGGERVTALECTAIEDGQTSVAKRFRIKLEDGRVARIAGHNIYMVKRSS